MGMTATERLRELLDERGVEYETEDRPTIRYTEWGDWVFCEPLDAKPHTLGAQCELMRIPATPEQAIAATLGRGECHDEDPGGYFVCSECGAHVQLYDIGRSYVDEFGKRWYATSHEHGLNYCPNCGRKVVYE